MRSCPKCGAQYTDDLRFCLHDGTSLTVSPTDDLNSAPTEQFDAKGFLETDASGFPTLPSAETEVEPRRAPPTRSNQYIVSAVEPATKLGCTMTLGRVAAALLFVAGLGAAGILVTSYQYSTLTAKVEPDHPVTSANSFPTNSDVGPIPGDQSSNTPTADSNVMATPATSRTPRIPAQATETPMATPMATPNLPGGTVNGGVLNDRAVRLPKPAYPAAAQAVRARGTVNVRVLVNEEGNVISATAIDGHPLLRPAAVAAARKAQFDPTQVGGRPAKLRGVLRYDFAP